MTDTPEIKPCPCCGADMIGGPRENSDNAGAYFYYHPHNHCALQVVCVWPHNVEAWNTRTAPQVKPLVWEEDENYLRAYDPETRLGFEIQRRKDGGLWVRSPGNDWLPTDETDAIKLAAMIQKDYERRILSALER